MTTQRLYPTISIITYCLCTALAAVWISFSFSGLSAYSVTFFSLFFAFCVFVVLQFRIRKDVFWLTRKFFGDILILNFLTLFSWLFAFMALYKIEPSIECAIFQGSLPIAVLFCDLITGKAKGFSLRSLGIFLIAANLVGLFVLRLVNGAAMFAHTPQEIWTGVAMAAVGGASAGVYVFHSGKLYAKANCTTLEILCNRFFLLLLVTGFLGLGGIVNATAAEPMILPRLVMLACVSVVIPMFALQYSVQTLGASKTSIITPLVPAIALALEQMLKGWPSIWIPVLIVTTCFALILANYWMNREKLQDFRLTRVGASNDGLSQRV
ncbi:hypothetical protein [Verminephrobacter aporrectodeae]|uniref:hypothetical protein n=1 Tax=Verminephrobacter aporrectodeae TaxID=1110389 RepID=UPI000680943A|nr:hypothetical protein [Verminephrobacter aporrectodeae]